MEQERFWKRVNTYLKGPADRKEWADLAGRKSVRYRIYKEREPDANPYYASSTILGQCAGAVKLIMESAGPHTLKGVPTKVLADLYKTNYCKTADNENWVHELVNCSDELVRDFAYFACHHIVSIDRIAGGQRSRIKNDTEIDITICLMPGFHETEGQRLVETACKAFGVYYVKLDEDSNQKVTLEGTGNAG